MNLEENVEYPMGDHQSEEVGIFNRQKPPLSPVKLKRQVKSQMHLPVSICIMWI